MTIGIPQKFNVGLNTVADVAALGKVAPTELGAVALSPESLLYYCSSRLDSIDKQIDTYFKDQQKANAASKQLGELQGILGRSSFQWSGEDQRFQANEANCQERQAAEGNEILAIYRNATSPEVKQKAADAFRMRTGHDASDFGDSGAVTAAQVKEAGKNKLIPEQDAAQWAQQIETVKTAATSISKGAELNMIQLQSLVSQRQLAIQLTTQLMQNIHEGMKNIAGNMRG